MKRILFLTSFSLFLSAFAFGQNGSDEPCSATALTVYSDCLGVTKSAGSVNAPTFTNSTSASSGVTLPTLNCNGFTTTTLDFWYSCVVPASGSVTILTDLGTATATYTSAWDMAIYTSSSSTCTGSTFTEIASECLTSTTTLSAFPYFQLTGQTPGATLYIRMWRTASLTQSANRTFAIWAVEGSITPPVTCPTVVQPANGSTLNGDPVFEWTADPNTKTFDLIFGSDPASLYILRDLAATDPPAATEGIALPHSRIGSSPFVYVTPGVTNYWYVVQKNCATNPNTSCTTNTYTSAPVPSNDNCVNAIALTVPDVYTNHTSASSSQSQAASTCSSATSDNASDVWFKFTTSAAGDVVVAMQSSEYMDAVLEVFDGPCGSLVAKSCTDEVGENEEETIFLAGLPANTTYYVRVYNYIKSSTTPSTLLYGYPFQMLISGNIGVVPVELVSFTGQIRENKNILNWHTASELDAKSFVVERSADGQKNFEAIGTVKANGTSAVARNYDFIDSNPLAISYYRLRQIDFDGKENMSKTISLQRTNKKLAVQKLFPSPVNDELTVQFSAMSAGNVSLNIVDILGRTVIKQTINTFEGDNTAQLKLNSLSAGSYLLVLSDGQNVTQMRIVKN